jgi:hypothetical protein
MNVHWEKLLRDAAASRPIGDLAPVGSDKQEPFARRADHLKNAGR